MQESFPDYYKIITNNLKKIRESKKLSQEAFAEILGCSREYISRLENNHEQISLQMLLRASREFKIRPGKFFE